MNKGQPEDRFAELISRVLGDVDGEEMWADICRRYAVVCNEQLDRLKDERPSEQWKRMQIAFSGRMRGLFGVAAIAVFYWAEIARVVRTLKDYQPAAEVFCQTCAQIAEEAYEAGYADGSGEDSAGDHDRLSRTKRRLQQQVRSRMSTDLLQRRRKQQLGRLHGTWLALKQFLQHKWDLDEEAFLHLPFVQVAEEPDVPMEKMQRNIKRRKQRAGLGGLLDDETKEQVFHLHDTWRALEAFLKNTWGITEPEGLWQLPMIAVTDHMLNVLGEARQVEACAETQRQMAEALRRTYRAFADGDDC